MCPGRLLSFQASTIQSQMSFTEFNGDKNIPQR